jgi:hypothetical protein
VLYLGVALWAARAILPAPASTLPYAARVADKRFRVIEQGDQHFVAAAVTGNARRFVTAPWDLFENGFCHPMRRAVTLGEHMFGNGLLGVVPWLLTRDPVFTTNAVVVLTLWLPALAMYALVHYWTASPGAAFVAGLLFAIHPNRVVDPGHPFVHGNQWTPLALLFAHRLFVRRRWRDAAGLVLFVGLQLLESFYQVVALAILGGTYGLYLLIRYWRFLPELAPKLLAAGVAVATWAALVLAPYLQARETWGIAGRGFTYLNYVYQFSPGRDAYPGSVVIALGTVALFDRLRGPRRTRGGEDPRLIYLAAGLVLFWTVVHVLPLPGFGVVLPSLSKSLRQVIPGLEAGRALAFARHGVYLVAAFLAGYGILALTARRGPGVRGLVVGLLAAAAWAEVFWPRLAVPGFGGPVDWRAYRVRPPAELVRLYGEGGPGGVVDIPMSAAIPTALAEYVFLSAYHHQPVAACYNSYTVPILQDVEALVARLPDERAAAALHALGFRTLVMHEERLLPGALVAYRQRLARAAAGDPRLVPLGRVGLHVAYRIESGGRVDSTLAALASSVASPATVRAAPPTSLVPFTFRNGAPATYRHPEPIEPTPLLVRWRDPSGAVVAETRVAHLLPIALARGEEAVRWIELPVPAVANELEVSLAPARDPDLVIARQRVHVAAASGGAP